MKMKKVKMVYFLKKMKKLFDDNDIEFWLDQGTLFGAFKKDDFFSENSEIDLGIWRSNLPKVLEALEGLDKNIKVYYYKSKEYLKLFYDDIEIDINIYFKGVDSAIRFLYIHEEMRLTRYLDFMIRYAHLNFPKVIANLVERLLFPIYNKGCLIRVIEVPIKFFKNLSSIKFHGMIFKAPSDIEEYIEYRYGKNWRQPNENYVYYRDDGAIKC